MRLLIEHHGARVHASAQWDSWDAKHQLRPRGEAGRAKWGRYLGARWLGFSLLIQVHNP